VTAPATFKQSDVKRAIAGALAADLKIGKISIAPDGTITIIPESSAANDDSANPWDKELEQ
jgi:hypothetical protein